MTEPPTLSRKHFLLRESRSAHILKIPEQLLGCTHQGKAQILWIGTVEPAYSCALTASSAHLPQLHAPGSIRLGSDPFAYVSCLHFFFQESNRDGVRVTSQQHSLDHLRFSLDRLGASGSAVSLPEPSLLALGKRRRRSGTSLQGLPVIMYPTLS